MRRRAVAALKDGDRRRGRACWWRRPSTTPRSPACSRTRSTGSRARSPTTPLRGKPAAVIGASTGLFGAVWAQAETRKVLGTIGARVVDRELPIGQADEALGARGLPLDRDAARRCRRRSTSCSSWPTRSRRLASRAAPQSKLRATAVTPRRASGRLATARTDARCGEPASRADTLGAMIEDLVEQIETRFAELGEQMTDPEVISDRERYAEVGRAYSQLEPAAKLAAEWRRAQDDAAGAEELLAEDRRGRRDARGARAARASASRSSKRRSAWRWSSATPTTRRA